jgi:hypothetical protein
MKMLLLTFFTLLLHQSANSTLTELRSCFQEAGVKQAAAKRLDQLAGLIDTNSDPVLIGYKGANEMIQAKYTWNPIEKWTRFNKGKALLQLAVSRDNTNLETRFLRFSIQSNIPSFLSYKAQMDTDKRFIIMSTPHSIDRRLKEIIINYFASTHILTAAELNYIKN